MLEEFYFNSKEFLGSEVLSVGVILECMHSLSGCLIIKLLWAIRVSAGRG